MWTSKVSLNKLDQKTYIFTIKRKKLFKANFEQIFKCWWNLVLILLEQLLKHKSIYFEQIYCQVGAHFFFDVKKANSDRMYYKLIWYHPVNTTDNQTVFKGFIWNKFHIYKGSVCKWKWLVIVISYNEMNNRFNLKQNFVQYIGLTKALQNYMKLLKKQLFKN